VIGGENRLTYAELQREALWFAAGLANTGIGSGDRVGLILGRSVRLPVAILGTLLRGAVFVPLDPEFPEARLGFMIADSRPGIVVVDDGARPRVDLAGARIVTLGQLLEAGAKGPAFEPGRIAGEAPAYVLYTSGSSGAPKGVVVPRGALANLLFSMREQPGLTMSDRLLAITTFNFDISLLELLLPMTSGAQLVIASREQALDGERLGALIRRHGITLLQATPSTWYQLLESGWQGDKDLRAMVGGERLSRELAGRLRPDIAELWNMYGPTETTIWSACSLVEPRDGQAITIGRPIAGTRLVVADAWGRVAGIGVQGEILISGAGVALGYLGKESMTAERFQIFPRVSSGEIFYRTGDVGRWTEGGQLECLGRTDSQVKVRGYRIEPGEIESVAGTVDGVSRAIVTTSASSEQDVRLLLHVQITGNTTGVIAALREELRRRLPEYMIPGAIIPVDTIPLLPNGKTDYARLPAATGITGLSAVGEAPLSDHELALHGIWCSLLQRKAVGRHENFFELGGHSLLAMRMVTRIREDLLLHCTLSQVFRSPTIARLGAALQQTSPHTDQSLVPLQLEGSSPPLFCICGVQLYRPLALHLADKGPLFAAYVPGLDSIVALGVQYLAMLREQQPAGPYRLMGFSLGGVIAYEIAQRLVDEGETVSELIILDSDAPGMGFADRLRSLRSLLPSSNNKPAARDEDRYLQSIRDYRAKRYTGHVVLVEATDTVHASRSNRWRRLIPDLLHLRLHSDHLAMMAEPRVTELATLLRPHLT
jgi:amino acid adenylation domain-containing protein